MLKELVDIRNHSLIEQGTNNDILTLSSVRYISDKIGGGSFGTVHEIIEINEKKVSNLCIKIYTNGDEVAKHAHETIRIFHQKVNFETNNTQESIYQLYPGLMGLPFSAFTATDTIEGTNVYGFIMFNLSKLGYKSLDKEDEDHFSLHSLDIENSLFPAYQLAKTVDFMHRKQFIHMDLGEAALWYNPDSSQLAVIDFDSGFHYNEQKKGTTIGKISQWTSAVRRKIIQLGTGRRELSIEEKIAEENWILANAIFELLFKVPPFFFLRDAEEETLSEYLKTNQWLDADENDSTINPLNLAALQEIQSNITLYKSAGLDSIIILFETTFNQGYFKPRKRPLASAWYQTLVEFAKAFDLLPNVIDFSSNKSAIKKKNENIELSWNIVAHDIVKINELVQPLFANSNSFNLEDSMDFEIVAISEIGEHKQKLTIGADKVSPTFDVLESSEQCRSSEDPVKSQFK